MRHFGLFAMAFIWVASAASHPSPGLEREGLLVSLSLVLFAAGALVSQPRRRLPAERRAAGLVAVLAACTALNVLQPGGAAVGGFYFAVVIAALRFPSRVAAAFTVLTILCGAATYVAVEPDPSGPILSLVFSLVPWYMVMRLIRQLRDGKVRAEGLVGELKASRAAQAEAAALAERGRMARELHDVLAHSLSALAIQLEGARLLARDRGADPEVVGSVERAHHLAASGLDEARRAIAALRGEELPGPERLAALAAAFEQQSGIACELRVSGEPIALGSETRLALYRTAQEALTNVRRHAAADRVTIELGYAPDGATLVVRDHGARVPVPAGGPGPGGGYGLTGMRERAELLGGRLTAGPTADGFRVELWLPGPA
jgi:signal transduction histidine kinase